MPVTVPLEIADGGLHPAATQLRPSRVQLRFGIFLWALPPSRPQALTISSTTRGPHAMKINEIKTMRHGAAAGAFASVGKVAMKRGG